MMQGLGDRPFQGQSLRHVINSEASAKLYSSNRRNDFEHNLARQYTKAWLTIHAIESNSSPSSVSRTVPRTAVHDSGLAGVMLGPGRGQLIPVANTVPASPSAPTVRLMEPTVKFVMLRSLWSTAQLGFQQCLNLLDPTLTMITCASIFLCLASPRMLISLVFNLIRAVPGYVWWTVSEWLQQTVHELSATSVPSQAPSPSQVFQHGNATVIVLRETDYVMSAFCGTFGAWLCSRFAGG